MPRGKKVTTEVDGFEVLEALDEEEIDHAPILVSQPPATMHDAFYVLCKAILNILEELPDISNVVEIQKRYADGHHKLAWQQIWIVTEGVVGVPY